MTEKRFFVELDKEELEQLITRYHFEKKDFWNIRAFYEALVPLVRARACFLVREGRAFCAVTLGEGIDELQEVYNKHEAVWEAYIIECLGNVLLEKAYRKLEEFLLEETGYFAESYEFPGAQIPVSDMGKILDSLRQSFPGDINRFPVQVNDVFSLQPKKSVVFVCRLGKEKRECQVCRNCPRKDCPNRQNEAERPDDADI